MAHVYMMDEGTVVVPFVNLEAAHAAYQRGQSGHSLLGVDWMPQERWSGDFRLFIHEEPFVKKFEMVESSGKKIIEIRIASLIIPARGYVREQFFKLHRMAKIRAVSPREVFHSLVHGATLQSLERPMAPPDWPLYRPGSFNK